MKSLTLSKDQRHKLLDLCVNFFPTYHSTTIHEDGFVDFVLSKDNKARIHWYQLCLTELPKRILYKMACDRQNKVKELTVDEFFNIAGSAQDKLDNLICDITGYPFKHPVEVLYNYCQQNK